MKIYSLLLFLILLCFSCDKNDINIDESDLLGEHWSENHFINGQPSTDFLDDGDLYSKILVLGAQNFYSLDFTSGQWSIEEDDFVLSNRGNFKIVSFTDSLFTVEGEMFAWHLYRKLNGIAKDEMITLRQDYRRR